MIDYDYILGKVGHIGLYQIGIILMVCCFAIPSGMNTFGPVFTAYFPDYRCNVYPIDNASLYNLTEEEILQLTTPYDVENEVYLRCERYDYDPSACTEAENLSCVQGTNDTIPCDDGYFYDRSLFTETIVTEFNLVCGKQIWVAVTISLYTVGVLFGTITFGNVADRIGRKPALVITALVTLLCMAVTAASRSFWLYSLSRIILSFFGAGAYLCCFVIIMEITSEQWRTLTGIGFQAFFAIDYMILSGIAYAWRDWHQIQWACIVVCLPLLAFLIIIPESPRWLFSVEKNEKAKKIVRRMAKVNRATIDEETWIEAEAAGNEMDAKTSEVENAKYSTLDLFRRRGIRMTTFKVIFTWAANSFVYYGVSLNVGALSGDIFVNNALSGVMEIVSYAICILVMDYTGRRILLAVMFLISGVTLAICAIVNEYKEDNVALENFTLALAFIGKMGISGSFAIIYNFTSELYPTVVRSNGVGIGGATACFGGALAPFVVVSGFFVSWLPNTLFGLVGIIAGVMSLTFPETMKMKMLETLDQAERFYAGKEVMEEASSTYKEKGRSHDMTTNAHVNASYDDEVMTYL